MEMVISSVEKRKGTIIWYTRTRIIFTQVVAYTATYKPFREY